MSALGAWLPTLMAVQGIGRAIGQERAGETSPVVTGVIAGLIYGALIGLAQLLILSQWLKRVKWWVVATAVGEAIYLSFVFWRWRTAYLGGDSKDLTLLAERGAIHGLAVGIAQSLVLRTRVRRSNLWILAMLIGGILGELMFRGYEKDYYLFILLGPFPIYGIQGLVSGIALAVLLRKSNRKTTKQHSAQN